VDIEKWISDTKSGHKTLGFWKLESGRMNRTNVEKLPAWGGYASEKEGHLV
jgi:hypothetical protein